MGKGVANIKFYVEKYKEKYEKQFGHVSFNKNYAHDNIKRALESKAVKSDSLSAVDRKFQFDILETDDEEEDDDEDDEDGDNEEDDNELSNCC
uniref:Uncharacterized protein n=1 Tax=Panagrolaimus davidi TaxID=227884 RepID=A0A914RC24_9BILA